MKYINVKEITIASLIKANGGSLECAGLRKAIRWGYSEYMEDFHSCLQSDTHISWDWLYPKIMDRPNYMSFLIDKGFIREVEPEVFYAKGDKFRHTSNYNIWTLSIHWPDATAMLVSEDGEVYNAPVTVSNSHKITRSEFKQICANNDEYFTKIEG